MSNTKKDDLLRVIKIDVLTASPEFKTDDETIKRSLPEIPLLNFELEDGKIFLMSNIPTAIAVEIARTQSGMDSLDSRLTIAELIPELAKIERVIIDAIVPFSTAYQATLEVTLEGVSEKQVFQLIPSHATLIATIANAPIFVSKSLIIAQSEEGQ